VVTVPTGIEGRRDVGCIKIFFEKTRKGHCEGVTGGRTLVTGQMAAPEIKEGKFHSTWRRVTLGL